MSAIRHIVLDLGNVLLAWDPERPYRRLIPDAAQRRRFLAEVCTPAWNDEQDRGRSWREAEEVLIAEHPEDAALIRAYRQNWSEMMPAQIDEAVAVFDDLQAAGHDVTALTNFATDTFEEARAKFPLLDRFRGVTVSGRIGAMKPELAIYRHHAAAFRLDPQATLFFDDKPDNVAGARAAGWHAEQFVDARRMRDHLARYRVVPAAPRR